MSNFATLSANLNLNLSSFAAGLKEAASMARGMADNINGQISTGITDPTRKSKIEFKDVGRIVQGILISKVFYAGMNAIKNATSSVFSFSTQLESAKVAYTSLFGSTTVATNFINVLQDFAAKTPFTFQQSETAARRLLAYGIQYKNVMYVMKGVLAASSMTGDPQTIESVSRALGQISTKGRLMNEEMRQLTDAGIPAYDILQKKLGLTQKQLQNLAKYNIPASKAINALVDGLNERFGSVANVASMTMKGIISNVTDNAQMLFSGMFGPAYLKIKTFVYAIEQMLEKLRKINDLKGIGGVFEAIFPPALQTTVRTFVANLEVLWAIILKVLSVVRTFAGAELMQLIRVFNMLSPIIMLTCNMLLALLSAIENNQQALNFLTAALAVAAAAWVLFKLKALGALIIEAVAGAIKKVSMALDGLAIGLVEHPWLTLFAVLIGGLAVIALSSAQAQGALTGLMGTLAGLGGIDASKVLLPEQKQHTADLNKFNNALTDTSNNMDNLASSTGKAKKAAESLLSFDEVFSLKTPDTDTTNPTGGGAGGTGGISIPTVDSSSLIPKIPDFTDFAKNFSKQLGAKLQTKLRNAGIGALIGGGLGAVLGGLLGGPEGAILGAKIFAVAGAVIGALWDDMSVQMQMGITGLGIGSVLGGILGSVIGGPGGALMGAAIGGLAAGTAGYLWDSLKKNLAVSITGVGIGGILGGIIGGVMGGPGGALIGVGIGTTMGMITASMWDTFSKDMQNTITGLGIGSVLGGIIGACFGGPGGALIGIGIGGLSGGMIGSLWSTMQKDIAKTITGAGIGAILGGIIGGCFGGPGGALIGVGIGSLMGSVSTSMWSKLSVDMKQQITGLGIGAVIGGIIGACFGGPGGALIGAGIGGLMGAIGTAMWQKMSASQKQHITGAGIGSVIGAIIGGVWGGPGGAMIGSALGALAGDIAVTFWDYLKKRLEDVGKKMSEEWGDITRKVINNAKGLGGGGNSGGGGGFGGGGGVHYLGGFVGEGTMLGGHALAGHAIGGVFNKEHIARFAEGGKAEAIIPLQRKDAMQPFVDAVAVGLVSILGPMLAQNNNATPQPESALPPMYVGTLIADDTGIAELERKLRIVRVDETKRGG